MVVAAGLHLPVRVAGGGAQGCGGTPVLAPLAQAADSGRVADALPAVALGSFAIGCALWRANCMLAATACFRFLCHSIHSGVLQRAK